MALVKCPDCGKMVSARVAACPECGCPAEYFENTNEVLDGLMVPEKVEQNATEHIVFEFKQCCIQYPANSKKYAGLYGDYLKKGYACYKKLCDSYMQLGNADTIVSQFEKIAQQMIDEQIDIILQDLYVQGTPMTMGQFKAKYSEKYMLDYNYYMDLFVDAYNEILGIQQKMSRDRAVAYANRGRWSGGGFGMKGALKGAMQASMLNMGSSMIGGMKNAVSASLDENQVDRKKKALFNNEEVMRETCGGIIMCMNGLFRAYTDELYAAGKLGSRINMDYEAAQAKFETALAYEKDKERLFEKVIECIGLYPSEEKFYKTIESELDECMAWKEFVSFWHLEFLYQGNGSEVVGEKEFAENVFLETEAKMDGKEGNLKLLRDLLVFEGKNPKDSKKIPIGLMKKVEKTNDHFDISLKGKFLLIVFYTMVDDIWVMALNNAMNGRYEKDDYDNKEVQRIIAWKKENIRIRADEAKEYILANFSTDTWVDAVNYYIKYMHVSYTEAQNAVADILNEQPKIRTYPGTENLDQGLFRGDEVVFFSEDSIGYLILTRKELINIDINKNKEDVYDIFRISHMKTTLFGAGMTFRYPGRIIEVGMTAHGLDADKFIDKIKNMKKGNFD